MVTKEQLLAARYGAEIHYTGGQGCVRSVGPRGGITVSATRVRIAGKVQTWKRDPARFRCPVVRGMYDHGEIVLENATDFHWPSDCPINSEER